MTDDELVAVYLRRLRRAARALPRARRHDLIDEITEHISEARALGAASGDGESATLRSALDRLGEPDDIVAAAGGYRTGPAGRDVVTVALLLAGGLAGLVLGVPGLIIGWGAGVVLLWMSPRWGWPDKVLGTLVWPGGLALALLLGGLATSDSVCGGGSGIATRCTGGSGLPTWLAVVIGVLVVAGPILVAIRLLLRARRNGEPGDTPSVMAS